MVAACAGVRYSRGTGRVRFAGGACHRPGATAARRAGLLIVACLAGSAAGPPTAHAEERPLRLAYVRDLAAWESENQQQRNYWDAYLPEVLDELGVAAEAIPPITLADAAALNNFETVLVGGMLANPLPAEASACLEAWVRAGGTLILSATDGLDTLCGNAADRAIPQEGGPFQCAATFTLAQHPRTRDVHSFLAPEQALLAFSPLRKVRAGAAEVVAAWVGGEELPSERAAITARTLGKGQVFYFAFHLPQTLWVLHQGRPVDRDYDGDNLLRRSDAIVIRPHAIEVAYADELLLVLQSMIGVRPHVFAHALPPDAQGEIPDALFHWGGDDEGSQDGIQVVASNWMKEHQLPYHINAMPRADGSFGLTPEDAQRIRANGHEISLHFNFVDNFPPGAGFTRDDVLAQDDAYERHFRQPWVCSVNHWTRWTGWTEPVQWMREAGGQADNSFVHSGSPPSNPVNRLGFSSGTTFPFWFYDDWSGKNARIDFLELPITAYECGYLGEQAPDFDTIHKVVDVATHYHQTMNMFFHPVYIANFPHCRAAIQDMLRYLDERGLRPLHCGNDELCRWWRARSAVRARDVRTAESELTFAYACDYPRGWIAKVALEDRTVGSVTVDGKGVRYKVESRFGHDWLMAVMPTGSGAARITWRNHARR